MICWSFSDRFLYLLSLFMNDLCNTLLRIDRVQTIPADIGKRSRPIPVIDNVTEVDVAPMITIESTDSNFLCKVFYFL